MTSIFTSARSRAHRILKKKSQDVRQKCDKPMSVRAMRCLGLCARFVFLPDIFLDFLTREKLQHGTLCWATRHVKLNDEARCVGYRGTLCCPTRHASFPYRPKGRTRRWLVSQACPCSRPSSGRASPARATFQTPPRCIGRNRYKKLFQMWQLTFIFFTLSPFNFSKFTLSPFTSPLCSALLLRHGRRG